MNSSSIRKNKSEEVNTTKVIYLNLSQHNSQLQKNQISHNYNALKYIAKLYSNVNECIEFYKF